MRDLDLFGDVPIIDTGDRNPYDFYPTPEWMTRSLLTFHPAIANSTVLECCSGRDDITRVLREAGCVVYTNDLDPRHPAETHHDATNGKYWMHQAPAVEWVISNLPFNIAMQILPLALMHAIVGVAFLFRKTFLEPTDDRGPWLQQHPPTRAIGEPRHSFRGTGNDSVSCDWYLWEKAPDRSLPPFVIDYVAERRVR